MSGAPRRCVVAVDDDATVLRALRMQLRSLADLGVELELAESGAEALELLDELAAEGAEVPVVIADQLMPGMSGAALLATAHARDPRVYTIMLTGRATSEAVGAAVNTARLYRFVAKPWDGADLLLTVRGALQSWEHERAVERSRAERARAQQASLRFVPQRMLGLLGREVISAVRSGDTAELELTVLFCGERRSAALRHQRSGPELLALIGRLVGLMDQAVHARGGFIYDVAGHATLAFFPGEPDAAVAAGVAWHRALAAENAARAAAGEPPLTVDVGVSSGPVLLGVRGEVERLHCAAVGDVINVASRVQSATAQYGARLLLTGETVARLRDATAFELRALGALQLRGRSSQTELFEVLDAHPDARRAQMRQTRGEVEVARGRFARGERDEALRALERALAIDPDDATVRHLHAAWSAVEGRDH